MFCPYCFFFLQLFWCVMCFYFSFLEFVLPITAPHQHTSPRVYLPFTEVQKLSSCSHHIPTFGWCYPSSLTHYSLVFTGLQAVAECPVYKQVCWPPVSIKWITQYCKCVTVVLEELCYISLPLHFCCTCFPLLLQAMFHKCYTQFSEWNQNCRAMEKLPQQSF